MPIVVLSYRSDGNTSCPRGCCYESGWDSDFSTGCFDTVEQAANFIAERIHRYPDAKFNNIVYDRWEDAVAVGHFCTSESQGVDSISTLYTDAEDYPGGYEEYNAYKAECVRKGALQSELSRLVMKKLADIEAAEKAKAAAERAKEKAKEEARRVEQERAQYERLKKRFGEAKPPEGQEKQ